MFNSHLYRRLVFLKAPRFYPILHQYPLLAFLRFCTNTSESHSFTVSYLINNLGFSPETALEVSKRLRLKASQKPDSVLTFFRNQGFSDSDVCNIVKKEQWLLSYDPHKTILPKLGFFSSKGVSTSDIVRIVTENPKILQRSLKNYIIPMYELVHRFLKSDQAAITCIIRNPIFLSFNLMASNLKLLIDFGVCDASIARVLVTRPYVIASTNLVEALEELKGLGFDASKSTFGVALLAKKTVGKDGWNVKVDALKKWGWSDETIVQAFRKVPNMMLVSCDKINAVMSFWVNQMGWDALALARGPDILAYNLEKRITPRAAVVQFLLEKGLRKKNASLTYPFHMPEGLFLSKFVKCFEEESSQLLKLYEENLNPAYKRENTDSVISITKHVTC